MSSWIEVITPSSRKDHNSSSKRERKSLKEDYKSSSKKQHFFCSKKDKDKHTTENKSDEPKFPEIGNFEVFWEKYKHLRDRDMEYNSKYGTTHITILLNIFGPRNFDNDEENIILVGEKVEKLAQQHLAQEDRSPEDQEIADDIVDMLNISCSVRSHPFWGFDENKKSLWKREKYKCFLKWHTRIVLDWFLHECVPENASMPSHIKKMVLGCTKAFKKISGDDEWHNRDTLSFEDWAEFLIQKGVGLSD